MPSSSPEPLVGNWVFGSRIMELLRLSEQQKREVDEVYLKVKDEQKSAIQTYDPLSSKQFQSSPIGNDRFGSKSGSD